MRAAEALRAGSSAAEIPAASRPSPVREVSLYRSPELRLVAVTAGAAIALLLALLSVLAERSDFLMLDFRQWRPSSSRRSGEELRVYFATRQSPTPEQRLPRLTLRLEPPVQPGELLAAEREIPVAGGTPLCLQMLALSPEAGAGAGAVVLVDGVVAAALPVDGTGKGRLVQVRGIRPRDGRVKLRLELRAGAAPPSDGAPTLHFEHATLRECDAPEQGDS